MKTREIPQITKRIVEYNGCLYVEDVMTNIKTFIVRGRLRTLKELKELYGSLVVIGF